MAVQTARVPFVREVAVAGDFVLVGGFSAWFLSRAIADLPGGLEGLLARSGVPPERRADVLRAHAALAHVGGQWRLEHATSTSGSPDGVEGVSALPSERAHRVLTSRDVASVLGISDRQVRLLGESRRLRGRRDSGGRWLFEAADVAAEVERRRAMRGAA